MSIISLLNPACVKSIFISSSLRYLKLYPGHNVTELSFKYKLGKFLLFSFMNVKFFSIIDKILGGIFICFNDFLSGFSSFSNTFLFVIL
jgi:hypothetical protein